MALNIFPNPVNERTVTISFSLETADRIDCRIFDASGRVVRTLMSGERCAGKQTLNWDCRDDKGAAVNGGVYFIRVDAAKDHAQGKLIIAN